jgi:glycosyltransferase 2 family protein
VRTLASSVWFRIAFTALVLIYLAWDIDLRAATLAILRVDLFFLTLVLALVACDRGVMILRWILLLRASEVAIARRQVARIFLIASFVGSFLPAGIGGDMARAYGLSRATADKTEALASVAVDRVLGILGLVVTGVVGLLVGAATLHDWRVAAAAALLVAGCLALFWADRMVAAFLPGAWRQQRLGILLQSLGDALSRYRTRRAVIAHVFAWSVGVQFLRIIQAYFLGVGLGLSVPFRYYLVFMPVGLLMLLLPVSVSGFGLPQGVIVWLMRPLGVPDEQSFALSTLIVLTGLAGNLPGVVAWLQVRRT